MFNQRDLEYIYSAWIYQQAEIFVDKHLFKNIGNYGSKFNCQMHIKTIFTHTHIRHDWRKIQTHINLRAISKYVHRCSPTCRKENLKGRSLKNPEVQVDFSTGWKRYTSNICISFFPTFLFLKQSLLSLETTRGNGLPNIEGQGSILVYICRSETFWIPNFLSCLPSPHPHLAPKLC